jgi:hypothetical protein
MLNKKRLDVDFCVVGGGMAGICAAIAAARGGSKVCLMHERPVLGGNASSEIRMWICGAQGENNSETGILEEIYLENLYRNPTKNFYIWDTVLYDFVLREPNITLLLNCTCMDAETVAGQFENNRNIKIRHIRGYQMTTQTFFDVHATLYADCSGDSILAPLTGAMYRAGREGAKEFGEDTHVAAADKMTMGMSCLIQGRETEKEIKFTPPGWSTKLTAGDFENRNPDIYQEHENFWYLELGGDKDSIHDTEEITKALIPLAVGTWDYIKNRGGFDSQKWELEFLGFLPGKRESRRLVGEYIITQKDISNNAEFSDTVAFGGWPIDDHFPAGFYHRGTPNTHIDTPAPYKVPYRAMYSKNVSNLFFAGRNISMTHMAMSSLRVMATCALMGQAVGTAAGIAREFNLTPHGVYENKLSLLQETLLDHDCFLPGITRMVSDLCKTTPAKGGDAGIKNGQDRVHKIYGTRECGVKVPNNKSLQYSFSKPEHIGAVHIVFDSDLNRDTLPGGVCERKHATRANVLLSSPQMYMPKTLCRDFVLEIVFENSEKEVISVTENRKRAYHIPVNKPVSALKLTPKSNWGDSDKTAVFSFDFK